MSKKNKKNKKDNVLNKDFIKGMRMADEDPVFTLKTSKKSKFEESLMDEQLVKHESIIMIPPRPEIIDIDKVSDITDQNNIIPTSDDKQVKPEDGYIVNGLHITNKALTDKNSIFMIGLDEPDPKLIKSLNGLTKSIGDLIMAVISKKMYMDDEYIYRYLNLFMDMTQYLYPEELDKYVDIYHYLDRTA